MGAAGARAVWSWPSAVTRRASGESAVRWACWGTRHYLVVALGGVQRRATRLRATAAGSRAGPEAVVMPRRPLRAGAVVLRASGAGNVVCRRLEKWRWSCRMGAGGEVRCSSSRRLQTHPAAREQIGELQRCGERAGVRQLAGLGGSVVAVEAVCWRGSPFTCASSGQRSKDFGNASGSAQAGQAVDARGQAVATGPAL